MDKTVTADSWRIKARRIALSITHAVELVLSLLLIAYISYDTFLQIPFLNNKNYMSFQLFVCLVFMLAFFVELLLADNKIRYLKSRWLFFLVAIPYLNIIRYYNIHISPDIVYYLRFIPLLRGAFALTIVLGYFSANKAVSLLAQYLGILVTSLYIFALLFYYQEYGVNKNVTNFWDALYWASMNLTTVGCYFSAVTPVGKIISVILPIIGMLVLPLFTVYFTDKVTKFYKNVSGVDSTGAKPSPKAENAPAKSGSDS